MFQKIYKNRLRLYRYMYLIQGKATCVLSDKAYIDVSSGTHWVDNPSATCPDGTTAVGCTSNTP